MPRMAQIGSTGNMLTQKEMEMTKQIFLFHINVLENKWKNFEAAQRFRDLLKKIIDNY